MIIIIKSKIPLLAIILLVICSVFAYRHITRTSAVAVSAESKALIAIIIDDFGNNSAGTEEMLSLPIKFTGAVMPSMEYTAEECEKLHSAGKEVILHLPMEPHKGKLNWLGSSPILNSYTPEKAAEVFRSNLAQIKYCQGVNNHMGSLVSENEELMKSILSIVKENNLIFADSVTSPDSKSYSIAQSMGIRTYKRDVFLDSTQDTYRIKQNLLKTAKIAKEKGYAVAIGHVGAEGGKATYNAIKSVYKEIEDQNIEFVFLSDLP